MSQSRTMSVIEAVTNTVGGFGVALACQVAIFPWFGVRIALASSAGIAVCMMIQSFVRQLAFRRFFEFLDRWLARRRANHWSLELEAEIDQQTATRLLQG